MMVHFIPITPLLSPTPQAPSNPSLGTQMAQAGLEGALFRLMVSTQNMNHVNSKPSEKGQFPYRRVLALSNPQFMGPYVVHKPEHTTEDLSDFEYVYDPHHPAADDNGQVAVSNVNPSQEIMESITANSQVALMQHSLLMYYQLMKKIYDLPQQGAGSLG